MLSRYDQEPAPLNNVPVIESPGTYSPRMREANPMAVPPPPPPASQYRTSQRDLGWQAINELPIVDRRS